MLSSSPPEQPEPGDTAPLSFERNGLCLAPSLVLAFGLATRLATRPVAASTRRSRWCLQWRAERCEVRV